MAHGKKCSVGISKLSMIMASVISAQHLLEEYGLTKEDLSVKVTDNLLTHLTQLMNNWRGIAPYLKLTETEREDIIDQGGKPEEQRLRMLEKWRAKFGKQASFCNLLEAFLKVNRRDLAEEVCEFFKKNEPKPKQKSNVKPKQQESRKYYESIDIPGTDEINIQDISTKSKEGKCWARCMFSSCLLLYCFVFLGSVVLIVIGTTIYTSKTPPQNTLIILNGYNVLVKEFKPFYVDNVTLFSDTYTELYEMQCQNLTTKNRTVEQSKTLLITQGRTYPISEHYLRNSFQLSYYFDIIAPSNSTLESTDCIAFVYVFDNLPFYISFLEHETLAGFASKQCLQNASFTLTVGQTYYYFIGLYVPNVSSVEMVKINITGYEIEYKTSQDQPDCVLVPDVGKKCTILLDRKPSRDPKYDVCILANTPANVSQVTYVVGGNSKTRWIGIALDAIATTCLMILLCCCYGFLRVNCKDN